MRSFFVVFFGLFCSLGLSQKPAFEVAPSDLIPEGIAFNALTNTFYISSIFKNKIVEVKGKKVRDFIDEKEYGFMGGVGMKVNAKGNRLWACSGNIMDPVFQTGIFEFDIPTGNLIRKFVLPADTVRAFFNDLVIVGDSTVYFTDTYGHCIWKWDLHQEKPTRFYTSPFLIYNNGIVHVPAKNLLFVATGRGLCSIDINTSETKLLPAGDISYHTRGIDGLVYFNNSLIAVQNYVQPPDEIKIIRYYLSLDMSRIEKAEVIDKNNPWFDIPTTAVLANNHLYVIANSHLLSFDQKNRRIKEGAVLKNLQVLKYTLTP